MKKLLLMLMLQLGLSAMAQNSEAIVMPPFLKVLATMVGQAPPQSVNRI